MRRTATLSIFAEEKDNNLANIDNLFSLNKKCKLELGIVNNVPEYYFETADQQDNITIHTINYQQLYGNIVWFPLGLYVMFNPSIAHSMTGVTISMNLKDKMCLLNGDLGGQIHSSVEFHAQDELVDADVTSLEKNPVLIYNIIKQLVNHWGNESLDNIIISQVPLKIKTVAQWTGQRSIFLINKGYDNWQLTFDNPGEGTGWSVNEIEPGYDAGYMYDPFVYPGELVCNAGQTVTSVLDKIIQVIGNYEYFYDVFGHFVFREKQNYLNMTNTAYWTKESNNNIGQLPEDQYKIDIRLTKPVYSFAHNEYTTAYNNTLNFNNIKNDFVVWGAYTAADGKTKYPCRFHLAIDKKPSIGHEHKIALYKDSFQTVRAVAVGNLSNIQVGTLLFPQASSEETQGKVFKVIDRVSSDWREQIYYQMCEDEIWGTGTDTELNNTYFQYYAELKEEFPKQFDLSPAKDYSNPIYDESNEIIDYEDLNTAVGWISDMNKHPQDLTYFLDFIEEDSNLGQYSVNNIGRRAKIINENDSINCVFEPVIPDVVFISTARYNNMAEYEADRTALNNMKQQWAQIDDNIYSLFSIGGKLNSCFERIKDMLYQYTHENNTISLTTLPIYYLEPNTRITIEDGPSGIYGDYIVQSLSLPLDISSPMTINAYKALQKI